MTNPFLPAEGFPDFSAITPGAAEKFLPALLDEARRKTDDLEKNATPGWDTFVRPLEDAVRPLWEAWGIVAHMLSVCNSGEWRAVQEKFRPQMVEFSLKTGQSRRFYELAKATVTEDPVRRRIVEKTVKGAEHSGVGLEGAAKERFNAIQAELAELSSTFRDHVLDATKAFSLEITDATGLPAQLKASTTVSGDPEKGPWRITIEDAVYVPFMQHCPDRAAREKVYRARATRASSGETDNGPLVPRILSLRREEAELLGFANYAELSIDAKSAPSVAAVEKMLDGLAEAALPVAARENASLRALAGFDPEPWDTAYFAERERETEFGYSEEELSRYFDFGQVLQGLFSLAGRLFGISVEPADGEAATWHPDVRFFRVRDGSGETCAHFYLDPYSRPETKSGGAWMNEFRTRRRNADGTAVLPLAVICCNQSVPGPDGRCLMRFREVETLFHEFGHALQHMLTTVDEPGASGLNLIEWDAVEIASQFMENWCSDAATLRGFASAAGTREPIPEALVAKVCAAKNHRAANACLRQVSFARIDLELHKAGGRADSPPPDAVKEAVFRRCGQPFIPEDRFLSSFTHIFSGGYAAGYYGYKWSEAMSADVFGAFEEAAARGGDALLETGRRYRETFLALGGGTDPMEVFRAFRGREPSIEPLLRRQGLK